MREEKAATLWWHWWWLRWSMIIEWSWAGVGRANIRTHFNMRKSDKKYPKRGFIPFSLLTTFFVLPFFRCRFFCLSRLVAEIFPFCRKDLPYLMLLLLPPPFTRGGFSAVHKIHFTEKRWKSSGESERLCVRVAGGGVGKIYVLVGGIFICFFFNDTERRAFEREKTFPKRKDGGSSYRRARSRKNHLLGKASATHTILARNVTFFLPLFKRKYVSLNGFHLHIFVWKSLRSEKRCSFSFPFRKSTLGMSSCSSLRWGWIPWNLTFVVCLTLKKRRNGSGVAFCFRRCSKRISRSTLSRELSFSRKRRKKKWHSIKSYFPHKLPRKAQLNWFVEIKYFPWPLGIAFFHHRTDLFACQECTTPETPTHKVSNGLHFFRISSLTLTFHSDSGTKPLWCLIASVYLKNKGEWKEQSGEGKRIT